MLNNAAITVDDDDAARQGFQQLGQSMADLLVLLQLAHTGRLLTVQRSRQRLYLELQVAIGLLQQSRLVIERIESYLQLLAIDRSCYHAGLRNVSSCYQISKLRAMSITQ